MNNSDLTIDGSMATWVMPRMEGTLGGTYVGVFKFSCYLNPIAQLQAGRQLRELLGNLGNQATDTEFNLAYALTQLSHRVISAPPFWTSTKQESSMEGNIGDLNVISAVLDAAMRSEALFKERIEKERETVLNRAIKVGEEILQKPGEE